MNLRINGAVASLVREHSVDVAAAQAVCIHLEDLEPIHSRDLARFQHVLTTVAMRPDDIMPWLRKHGYAAQPTAHSPS